MLAYSALLAPQKNVRPGRKHTHTAQRPRHPRTTRTEERTNRTMTKTRLVSVCFLICNAFLPLQGFTSSYKKGGYSFSVRKNARSPTLLKSSTTEPQTQEVGYVVGDTKGAALMIKDIAVSRGGNQLLGDIDWSVQRYERWGIVGPNVSTYCGCTLFFWKIMFFARRYSRIHNNVVLIKYISWYFN